MNFQSHSPAYFPKRELLTGEEANGDPQIFVQGSPEYADSLPARYYGTNNNSYLAQFFILILRHELSKTKEPLKNHDLFLTTTIKDDYEDTTGLSSKFPEIAEPVFSSTEYSTAFNIWSHMNPDTFQFWAFALYHECVTHKKEWMFSPLLSLSIYRDELVSIPEASRMLTPASPAGYERLFPRKRATLLIEDEEAYDRRLYFYNIIKSTGDIAESLEIAQTLPLGLLQELYAEDEIFSF